MTPSIAARDVGATLVLANTSGAWRELAEFYAFRYLASRGAAGDIFEQARAFAELCGVGEPHHRNAWGALALSMAAQGLIVRTGEYRQSSMFTNHARSAAVWKVSDTPIFANNSLLSHHLKGTS